MARHETVTCAAGAWTQLTSGDVTEIRCQNRGQYPIFLQATVGATPPSNSSGAVSLGAGETLAADLTLAQLFPGVSGANRVYAWAGGATEVSVSHA